MEIDYIGSRYIACRIVDSCARNYIPACQALFLDGCFCHRNGNSTFCPAPCTIRQEGLPLLRVWVHGRSRAGGQEDGTRGTPCHTFAHFDRGKLRRPALDPAHDPGLILHRLRCRECWFLYLFGIHREALRRKDLRGFLPCWTSHGRRGIVAGAGARECSAGGSAGDIAPTTCRPASTRQEGSPCRWGRGFHCQRVVLSLILL